MADNVLSEGIKLYNKGSYSDALAFFLGLEAESGADGLEVSYYLGLTFAKLKRYEDALVYLEQVVTSGTQIERVLQCRFLLAVIYVLSGRKRLADFELNKLLETGYKRASVLAVLAYISWEQKNIDTCIEYYEKALEAEENNITALNGLGYVLAYENRDLTKALSLCKKAVEFSSDSAACLDSLGFVYYKMGLYEDALKFLEEAENIEPENIEILEHIKAVKKADKK